MRRFIYTLLLPVLLVGCKKHDLEAPSTIRELVGKWRLEAVEKIVNGQKVWEKATGDPPTYLVFRFDGVMLDGNELPYCCSPDSLVVNGTSFRIKPLAEIPENPQCHLVDCATCSFWQLEQKENELVLTSKCEFLNYRYRYLRE